MEKHRGKAPVYKDKQKQRKKETTELQEASFLKKSYDQTRQHMKKQRYYFTNKGPSSQSYDFSNNQV